MTVTAPRAPDDADDQRVDGETVPVSRMEVFAAVLSAFDAAPCDRAALIQAAVRREARDEVVSILRAIPDWPYVAIDELWLALPALSTH